MKNAVVEHLRAAADQLERAANAAQRKPVVCPTCKQPHLEDWDNEKRVRKMRDAAQRNRRLAGELAALEKTNDQQ